MNKTIRDNEGKTIAWANTKGDCENPNCRKGIADNRPIHVISYDEDKPYHLVMPDNHYVSIQEGLDAIAKAEETAITVNNRTDRDNAYKRKVPVKILKGYNYYI